MKCDVCFDGYQLVGTRFFPPPDPQINEKLRAKKIFIINIDDEGKCECICFRGHKGPHPADIVQFDCDGFQLDCCNSEIHQHPGGFLPAFDSWLKEELGVETVDKEELRIEDLTSKYNTLSQEVSMKCRPLHLPRSQASRVIQPGLFKGDYSSHGLELVILTYDDEEEFAVLTKITGDPNVPAGNISIIADLNAPVVETKKSNTESDAGGDDPQSQEVSASGLPLKRFRLPSNIYPWQEDVPEFFEYKFSSNAQIAGTGYEEPQFVRGQWVIFDGDTFGHVWLTLAGFAMYKRVTENFSA